MSSSDMLANDLLAAGQAAWRREPEAQASTGEMPGMPGIMIDEQAFHVLYRRTAPSLRAYAARVLGSAMYADDIVQESYLRLVRSPPATDDPQQLRAFLFRVASHLIVDHWRRGRHVSGRSDESADTRGAPGPDIPLRLDMARVFEQLTPQQRQLMWLAYVEGADHREIAAALGLRERSVRVLLHRTRRKMAQLLREGGRGPEQR
ncbi:MAG: sigma-70 family RNA polymerase sigma factor [Vicinamibacterales bacterium]